MGKIVRIPHGVDLNLFYSKDKPNKCVFLANKGLRGWEDRGGIQYLLKAYLEEFTDEDVELIIKINPAYGVINLQELIDKYVDKKLKYPKLTVNDQLVRYEDLVKFYNKGTVFVSPTRAEAFNIPCAESSACGLMSLTTGFGGQTDFIRDGENGLYIDYDITPVTWDLMYESCSWATPKMDDLKKKLRWCYENPDKVKQMGNNAQRIIRDFTWDKTAEKIISLK